MRERIPLSRACLWILSWTLLVSGCAAACLFYYMHIVRERALDPKYHIVAIVQTGPVREALKTVYLAELLDLSCDRPVSLYRFNTSEGERKLLASPLIKTAAIKKIPPGTLYIDYVVRQPVAFLGEYANVAIDAEGYIMPFHPFFSPKHLPIFILGEECAEERVTGRLLLSPCVSWGERLGSPHYQLAAQVLQSLTDTCVSKVSHVRKIDVSKAYADSYGQRQIVVIMEDILEKECEGHTILCVQPRILRLNTKNYLKELQDYLALRNHLLAQESQQVVDSSTPVVKAEPMIIDMRIPSLAFFKERT